jgi:uncharacterized repeat protein (TIGR03803 family)
MDGKGNLYGTTYAGGTSNFGSVFKLDTAGKETVLHSFTCGDDGCFIYGTPAMDAEGNLYGTAVAGGSMSDGTAWKVTPQGVFTVLYSFAGDPDGSGPGANVIIDAEGNIYGDTTQGGISNDGTVFKLDHRGTETILHSFNGSDGSTPWGGPIRDASGTLFGTTQGGGTEGNGTVWKITP